MWQYSNYPQPNQPNYQATNSKVMVGGKNPQYDQNMFFMPQNVPMASSNYNNKNNYPQHQGYNYQNYPHQIPNEHFTNQQQEQYPKTYGLSPIAQQHLPPKLKAQSRTSQHQNAVQQVHQMQPQMQPQIQPQMQHQQMQHQQMQHQQMNQHISQRQQHFQHPQNQQFIQQQQQFQQQYQHQPQNFPVSNQMQPSIQQYQVFNHRPSTNQGEKLPPYISSSFYNDPAPPIGFNIIGRGNLPSVNFMSQNNI
ncbi:hypothetical protein TRFO_16621 [Tritrichomonas foetus]|uniref:Uncharacterized protein n=1 Tax=Tritrichomonas foetus TaxID=1144522 RepID=A0A1J4KUF5_9EUKA|nr:hypothetical protein TRFO_16621 [Tritrichomonas foetus]|eukprot:OHT13294.1 hypothetical protein TRFO_16621 [Tritrichomonas foetus]